MPDMAPIETIYFAQVAPQLTNASENAAVGFIYKISYFVEMLIFDDIRLQQISYFTTVKHLFSSKLM